MSPLPGKEPVSTRLASSPPTAAVALTIAALTAVPASALGAAEPKVPEVIVTTTPLDRLGVPRDRVPANVQSASSDAFNRQKPTTIAEFMDQNMSGVYVNEAQSNPFQPDLSFRGFTASPLLGNPIGLSVFVDGVRVNESFGDTVFWDLIPTSAIERVDLVPGSNPVFGLNTLGGALAIRTKSGRDERGLRAELTGGSFGRRSAQLEVGAAGDALEGFLTAHYYDEDGWRDHSPSTVRQVFGKAGWQTANTDLELLYTHASNNLRGNGLVPEAFLRERREAIYTHFDETKPELDFVNLTGNRSLNGNLLLTGNVYRRDLDVSTFNSDSEFDDGGTPLDPLDDAYVAENRRTVAEQRTTGAALQLSHGGPIASRENHLTIGASWDRGQSEFQQLGQEARFTSDRGTTAAGEFELYTRVRGRSDYLGFYVTDTLGLGDKAHLTLSGRYNKADVEIGDASGAAPELNGRHSFHRFNPAVGLTYAFTPGMTGYAGYNEGFRAPSPVELTCADESAPCSLPVGFVADPPLEPVVARTFEAGVRGSIAPRGPLSSLAASLSWNVSGYQTDLRDDILFTAAGNSQGFFSNVPGTRRRGLELGMTGTAAQLDWSATYAIVDATFRSDVELFNPIASESDPSVPHTIRVTSGHRIPGIPRHLAKLSADHRLSDAFAVGGNLVYVTRQHVRGDEDNRLDQLPGYAVLNLRAGWRPTETLRLFARLDNVLDRKYATLGALNRNAFDTNSEPLEGVGPGPVQRFVSPGVPRSFWVGIEYDFDIAP